MNAATFDTSNCLSDISCILSESEAIAVVLVEADKEPHSATCQALFGVIRLLRQANEMVEQLELRVLGNAASAGPNLGTQ